MRLLFYPEVSLEEIKRTGVVRAGAHSDYGAVTLLLQKPGIGQNGLRALNSERKWVKVNPPDYALVVNLETFSSIGAMMGWSAQSIRWK